MSDLIRDTFLNLVKGGMTYLEAYRQFDREQWNKAMTEEIMNGDCIRDPDTFRCITQDGKCSLLDLGAKAQLEQCDENAMEQAIELWLNGWTSHPVTKTSMVMSWYWRRPAKPPRKVGRLFLSTNQAWMALRREKK